MIKVGVLSMHDLERSSQAHAARPGPGGPWPYGMADLGRSSDLSWSDGHHRSPWTAAPFRGAAGAVRRWAPGWQGSLAALLSRDALRGADVVVSVFENVGLGLGALRQQPFRLGAARHLMITCWLAEDCQHLSSRELRSVRHALRGVDRIAVFSSNQAEILEARLGVEAEQVVTVPFGVDTAFYDPAAVGTPPGGGGVVAVGSDSRRDYETLFESARLSGVPMTVVCQPRNIVGLTVPPNVTVRHGVYDAAYRQLLHAADVVVTPTVAPAYPCGQSVVLEAMCLGRATVTTDSPALRDYVTPGVDGVLVEAKNAGLLAAEVTGLLDDARRRDLLGAEARRTVTTRFSFATMWGGVAEELGSLV